MSQEKDTKSKKDELLNAIESAQTGAEESVSKGRGIVEKGQYIADIAKETRLFLRNLQSTSDLTVPKWNRQIEVWRRAKAQFDGINHDLEKINREIYTSMVTATSSAASGMVIETNPIAFEGEKQYFGVQLINVIEREKWNQKAEQELRRLGLDVSAAGRKSALDLLREAYQEFRRNSPPAAILIPIREAINVALNELLRRRPAQEPTKNRSEKFRSIATHCGKDKFDEASFENIIQEDKRLTDDTSSGKQEKLTREEVRARLIHASTVLVGFLRIIDERKLKP